MLRAFTTGALAGYGIAVPVGAIAVLIVDTGIRGGPRPALAAGAGTATADMIYAVLAVVGGASVVSLVGSVETTLRVLSGLVLTVIGVTGLVRARRPVANLSVAETGDLARTYARFLGLTMVNPATVVYFAAVVVGLGVTGDTTEGEGLVFALGAGLASLSWQSLLALFGAFAGSRLTPGRRVTISVVGNLVILGFALVIILG
ncbi:MAG: LysE family transporter [Actinobacteria bacterium]|nr:LysE family transporter [Actinomycetota bacterium]MCI0543153.1 LysE family transporter [Actinomycetota bacterium]MCI0678637.1 LysE family transporter [Actinomycetota bacterium]